MLKIIGKLILNVVIKTEPMSVSSFRFDEKENVSNCIQLKTSVIKGIKNQLVEQFPDIESWLNNIMPKKDPVKIVRW